MKIVFPTYLTRIGVAPHINEETLSEFENVVVGKGPIDDTCWVLSWGGTVTRARNSVIETGFFWDAMHIDTIGLYKHSSLNTVKGWHEVMMFTAPKSAQDVIHDSGLQESKYRQADLDVNWDGVVLALQNPVDRSVHYSGSTEDYYDFVRNACKYYKKHLFLKVHPWNNGEVLKRFEEYALENGCKIAKCNHTVLKKCKFVLTYNSSFSVDCFLRDVPVAQYAPGYFSMTPAVTYTEGKYPDDIHDTCCCASKLVDFLVWKYCFNLKMPIEKWMSMMEHFSKSKELFPMTDEWSYGANV